ncbi:MAG: MBL fold metallo-hydrolase [Pseudomonadota bacterium]
MHRRDFLAGSIGALSLAATASSAQSRLPAFEGVQRLRVGNATITALSDGYVDFITPQSQVLQGIEVDAYEAAIAVSGRGAGARQTDVNAYVVEIADRKIMIDAGTNKGFVPTLGRTQDALTAAGFTTEEITDILITHLHPDHSGGLIGENGEALFPDARVLVHQLEHEYWVEGDPVAAGRPDMEVQFQLAKAAASLSGDRWELFSGTDLGLPGITAEPLFGHTPGHVGCMIEADGERVFVVSDIVHQPVIQIALPAVSVAFDVDRDVARQTRQRTLDRAAADGERIIGMHLPFPGAGYVERAGEGYRWIAEERQYF